MYETLNHENFYACWKEICEKRHDILREVFHCTTEFTNEILKKDDCVIDQAAAEFGKKIYHEYYSLDAVIYDEADYVVQTSNEEKHRRNYWLKRILVAFEHENDPHTAYQEISHLLTTKADLRVLVTYVGEDKTDEQADKLAAITTGIIDSEILLIIGFENKKDKKVEWKGYILSSGKANNIRHQF